MAPKQSRSFDGDVSAPGRARHFAVNAVADRASAEVLDDIAMIVSELVTNAVRAGAGRIAVAIEADPDSTIVRFTVSDDVAGWPVIRQAAPHEVTGRGLPIVAALASDWGIEAADGVGKRVWATLPVVR